MTEIGENIQDLRRAIDAIARDSGRPADSVRLMAVSKMQPDDRIAAALDAGQRLFGENRVQEAVKRWENLRPRIPGLELHLIGSLQSNKAADAVRLFDCIETVDRESLAAALAREMKKQGRNLPCFIQVNTGLEEQKAGVAPAGLPGLLAACREKGLNVTGLMCIPPVDEPPAMHFALLQKLAARHGLKELSMGMSGDFAGAIPLGATIVRVGTGVFGERMAPVRV
jgi:pyridoxal phosphate enzyme (YggS family)